MFWLRERREALNTSTQASKKVRRNSQRSVPPGTQVQRSSDRTSER